MNNSQFQVNYRENGKYKVKHFYNANTAIAHANELRRLPADWNVTAIRIHKRGVR